MLLFNTLYQTAGLWRKEISFAEKRDYLRYRSYYKYLEKINPSNYRKISENKLSKKSLLQMFAVPTPRFVGYLHRDRGYTSSGAPLRCAKDLIDQLRSVSLPKICLKNMRAGRAEVLLRLKLLKTKRKTPKTASVRALHGCGTFCRQCTLCGQWFSLTDRRILGAASVV